MVVKNNVNQSDPLKERKNIDIWDALTINKYGLPLSYH
jgi:hypothetical protein